MQLKGFLLSIMLVTSLPMVSSAQHSERALNDFQGVPFGISMAQADKQLKALGFVWYENHEGDGIASDEIAAYDGLFYGRMVTIGAHFYNEVLVSMSVMVEAEDESRIFRQLILDHRMPKMEKQTINLLWFYPQGYVDWQPRDGFSIVTFFSFKAFSMAQERSMS